MAIRESELPSLLAGEGHPVKVELVHVAAERMADEQADMEQLRSYVTWAAMHKKVPISWAIGPRFKRWRLRNLVAARRTAG